MRPFSGGSTKDILCTVTVDINLVYVNEKDKVTVDEERNSAVAAARQKYNTQSVARRMRW